MRRSSSAWAFAVALPALAVFYHPDRHLSLVVHGDDFTCLGSRDDLLWYEKGLSVAFEIKIKGRLGESKDADKEIRMLNRVVRLDSDGLAYEADPQTCGNVDPGYVPRLRAELDGHTWRQRD